jgi:hypothetical protein
MGYKTEIAAEKNNIKCLLYTEWLGRFLEGGEI